MSSEGIVRFNANGRIKLMNLESTILTNNVNKSTYVQSPERRHSDKTVRSQNNQYKAAQTSIRTRQRTIETCMTLTAATFQGQLPTTDFVVVFAHCPFTLFKITRIRQVRCTEPIICPLFRFRCGTASTSRVLARCRHVALSTMVQTDTFSGPHVKEHKHRDIYGNCCE